MANFKNKKPSFARAGCKLCKPNKFGHGMEKTLGHRGFGNIRREQSAERDMKE